MSQTQSFNYCMHTLNFVAITFAHELICAQLYRSLGLDNNYKSLL